MNSSGVIAVGAANLPDGRILSWAAGKKDDSVNTGAKTTHTTIFNPADNSFTEALISNTEHDMFCPGTANLPDGRIMIAGGRSSSLTTIYNPITNSYSKEAEMNTPQDIKLIINLHVTI